MASRERKPGEREWKIAAIGRLIPRWERLIAGLESSAALVPCHPSVLIDLAIAREQLARLKAAKRKPALLRVHAHEFLQDAEAMGRVQRARGSSGSGAAERLLAAINVEQTRLIERYGSVERFRKVTEFNRRQGAKGRARSDKWSDSGTEGTNVADIVASLAREHGTARELWEKFGGMLREKYTECEALGLTRYRYVFQSKGSSRPSSKTVGLKHFGQLLRDERARLLGKARRK